MFGWFESSKNDYMERNRDWFSKTSELLEKMNDSYEKAFGERPFVMHMELPEYYYYLIKFDEYRMSR